MYKRKAYNIPEAECIRLEEISFCNFIKHLYSLNSDPTKIYDFVENICSLAGCNLILINNAVTTIMTQARNVMPTREEHVQLLSHAGVPVRKVVETVGVSQRDYYAITASEPLPVQPRFLHSQYLEMVKFMDFVCELLPERM